MKKQWMIWLLLGSISGNIYAQDKPMKKAEEGKSGLHGLMGNVGRQETAEATKLAFEKSMKSFAQMNNSGLTFFQDLAILDAANQLIKFKDESALAYVAQIQDANLRHKGYAALPKTAFNKKNIDEATAVLKLKIAESATGTAPYYAYQTAYANLLYRTGQYKAALDYIKPISSPDLMKNSDLQTYALILQKNKAYLEASRMLEDIIKQGVADEELKMALKESWMGLGKSEKDFPAHLETLFQHLRKDKEISLAGQQVNYPAPLFALTDLSGKTVSLEDLRGKVVFLDFWATWCGPCVASFPAMQKAVDKYRNHPEVVFLFINTLEKEKDLEKRRKQVDGFIRDKGFSFQILMDDQKSGAYELTKKYKVAGIPAKFVIDKAGNVRYALSGFTGATDAAFEEVNVLIETALKL
ncbi:TlpA disulfide reductase family protein [Pedobacter gandavensis]|uniref:TlpA family protein disulfide reductase n=1 Tax=Pedobacter gandavensis TaxID=2679963 RepID=UPI00292D7A54|nr:TlpA disulfide reductase family protein [Pedobacter gandavensis]